MKKWSLIVFTIFSQMAVGAFWVLWGIQFYFFSPDEMAASKSLTDAALFATAAIMLISLLLSLLHLGTPTIAYRAIFNLRTSWLSREILFAVLFTATSILYTYMQFGQSGSDGLRAGIAWMATIFGFMLVYSMSRLYMVRTVPVWNTNYTLLSFFLTALILGGLLVSVIFVVFLPAPPRSMQVTASVSAGVLLLLVSQFILIPAKIVKMLSGSRTEQESIRRLFEQHKNTFYTQLVIGVAGAAGLGFTLFQARYNPIFYAICFILILAAELADRYLFYTARDVIGM